MAKRLWGSTKIGIIGKHVAALSASPAGDEDGRLSHLGSNDEAQAARSDVVGSEGSGRLATRTTGPITTAPRPAPLKGLAMLVELNFQRSLRSGGDDRLHHRFDERSEPPWQIGACSSFFMRRRIPHHDKGRGFQNYALGQGPGRAQAGSRRPPKSRLSPPIPVR